jgi:hypothetical protein
MTSVLIHGVPCALLRAGEGFHVVRTDTGAKVAEAWSRLLAVANAAQVLHTPRKPRTLREYARSRANRPTARAPCCSREQHPRAGGRP